MSLLRFKMLETALSHKAVEVKAPSNNPSDYFGERVFGRKQMRKYLSKQTYEALIATIENNWLVYDLKSNMYITAQTTPR